MTNGKKSDIIIERPKRGSKKIPLLGKSGSQNKGSNEASKKTSKKLLKNPLTNRKESDIINRLSQRNGTAWHGGTPDRLRDERHGIDL